MPIGLDNAQDHHPLELTREASPEVPMMAGDFSLDQLREKYGTPDMPEEEVLAAAGDAGMAFFKAGDIYRSFTPQQGDAVEPIVSPSQDSGVAVDGSSWNDTDGPLGDDDDEEGDEDVATMADLEDAGDYDIPESGDMLDPDDEAEDGEYQTGSGQDDPINSTDEPTATADIAADDDDEEEGNDRIAF